MKKQRILIFIDWYLPGYKAGGPIQSVANIISHLKNDFDFSVVTSDTDLHETTPYKEIKSDEWNILNDGTRIYYFSKAKQSYNNLKRLMIAEQYDTIYMNSFFSKFFTLFPLMIARQNKINCRAIVAPRGMLGSGALQLKSTKKNLFIKAAKIFGLYKSVVWHASTVLESDEVEKVFGNDANIAVAINLSKKRVIKPVHRIKEKGELKLAFLSRISPKKNLLAVYNYLNAMPRDTKITFDYFGTVDDKLYHLECLKLFAMLPANIKANYCGVLEPVQITDKLSEYHFTILPTLNENFGHSIVESWVAGCPVIISDQTPWRNLKEKKCGWDLPLEDDNFISVLKKCTDMQQEEFNQWSGASYQYAEQIINDPVGIEQNKKLFNFN